jgi:hypothetical protein
MKIMEGRYYQNSKGLIRYVDRLEQRSNRWSTWTEVVYYPISPTGKRGQEKVCALSTMQGWAKREYDPNAIHYVSPKREEAANMLQQLTGGTQSMSSYFVDLCVEAAKEELRRELGLESGHIEIE